MSKSVSCGSAGMREGSTSTVAVSAMASMRTAAITAEVSRGALVG
jgi:hypothetical protein